MGAKHQDQITKIKRLKALADTGLIYSNEPYDLERYEQIKEISLQLMADVINEPLESALGFYKPQKDYPTPKVDVRCLVINQKEEILMVKEKIDGKWTIPGGWADIGYTASEVAVKEVKEETGLEIEVDRLLAIYDKKCHPHPPQPHYVYKIVFLGVIINGNLSKPHDILEVGFFPIDQLPELSEDRILESQIKELVELSKSEVGVVFD